MISAIFICYSSLHLKAKYLYRLSRLDGVSSVTNVDNCSDVQQRVVYSSLLPTLKEVVR